MCSSDLFSGHLGKADQENLLKAFQGRRPTDVEATQWIEFVGENASKGSKDWAASCLGGVILNSPRELVVKALDVLGKSPSGNALFSELRKLESIKLQGGESILDVQPYKKALYECALDKDVRSEERRVGKECRL